VNEQCVCIICSFLYMYTYVHIYIYTHNGQTCIVQYDLKISYIWCSSYVRYIVLCVYTCVYMCV
jgi:hypothetical protein